MTKNENECVAPVWNYYGSPYVREENGKFWIGIDGYGATDDLEVSREFYEAWIKEFQRTRVRSSAA